MCPLMIYCIMSSYGMSHGKLCGVTKLNYISSNEVVVYLRQDDFDFPLKLECWLVGIFPYKAQKDLNIDVINLR